MPKNRNHLIDLLIGNLANAVVHNVLEKTTDREEIANRYRKEAKTSMDRASEYRKKINPEYSPLSSADVEHIREKAFDKATGELLARISRKYKNIDLTLVESSIARALSELNII